MSNASHSDIDVSLPESDLCYGPAVAHRRRVKIMAGARRHILVIEDDAETAAQIADFLSERGYQVDLAANGDDGLKLAQSTAYAVMAIDRMLPGIDGIAVIRRLREAGIVTPALIVSALGEVDERVRGLRVGDLELDLVSRTANRNGRDIKLLPREFQVLEFLVRNEGRVVPRSMLLERVWDLH